MVASAKQFGWSKVSLIYSDCPYGRAAKEQIVDWARKLGLCIFQIQAVPTEKTKDYQEQFRKASQQLWKNLPHAPGVLVFTSKFATSELLKVSSSRVVLLLFNLSAMMSVSRRR